MTTGAHTAGPMCCIGRIFGSKVIYIETFANITTKTITGSLFYKFKIANLFIVQWKSMLKLYPKATYGGGFINDFSYIRNPRQRISKIIAFA